MSNQCIGNYNLHIDFAHIPSINNFIIVIMNLIFKSTLCSVLGVVMLSCQTTLEEAKLFPKVKHVFLIGIDAWGAYSYPKSNIPNISQLMANGSYTLKKRSVLPSTSAPNWASMYMGACTELHGYCEWGSKIPDLPSREINENNIFPTVFSLLRKNYPQAEIGNICEWDGIRYLVDTLTLNYDKYVYEAKQDSTATVGFAVEYIKREKPTFLNIVFDALDHVGHTKGHDTHSYYDKLTEIDNYVGDIITAIKEAGIWEESVVIVTADHGGIGHGHGGYKIEEVETPFVICGKGIKQNYEIQESMMQYDVASTIAYILGLKQPQVWIGRCVKSIFNDI